MTTDGHRRQSVALVLGDRRCHTYPANQRLRLEALWGLDRRLFTDWVERVESVEVILLDACTRWRLRERSHDRRVHAARGAAARIEHLDPLPLARTIPTGVGVGGGCERRRAMQILANGRRLVRMREAEHMANLVRCCPCTWHASIGRQPSVIINSTHQPSTLRTMQRRIPPTSKSKHSKHGRKTSAEREGAQDTRVRVRVRVRVSVKGRRTRTWGRRAGCGDA